MTPQMANLVDTLLNINVSYSSASLSGCFSEKTPVVKNIWQVI